MLVDGDRGAFGAGAVVGKSEPVEVALDLSILTGPTVEGDEDQVGDLREFLKRNLPWGEYHVGVGVALRDDGTGLPDFADGGMWLVVLQFIANVVRIVFQQEVDR